MTEKLKVEMDIRSIPLPHEKRAEWDAAMQILTRMLFQALEIEKIPSCPECLCDLHLTVDGKRVCRNEICPNYG